MTKGKYRIGNHTVEVVNFWKNGSGIVAVEVKFNGVVKEVKIAEFMSKKPQYIEP